MFLGEDLLAWMVLAFGAALAVGNVLAYVRPPSRRPGDLDPGRERPRPPLPQTIIMALVGVLAAIWAVASLVKG